MTIDIESTRRDLIAMRVKFGADTPKGHACSNLIEQLENYERTPALDGDPFMSAAERKNLAKLIRESHDDLTKMTSR